MVILCSENTVKRRSGFTLIELLIVIAIIAILAIVVVLVLNPIQLFLKARDSSRLSDLPTLTTALNLYAEDVGGSMGSSSVTYISIPDPAATSSAGTDCSGLGFPGGGSYHCASSSTYRNTNGTGWIPVNLTAISTRSPLGSLPVDPINKVPATSYSYSSGGLYYSYQTDGTKFKLTADPEYSGNVTQAGSNPNLLVLGTNPLLNGGSWVLVPGNSTFGTSNFYVMKYSAVCSDGNGNYINDNNTADNTYSDTGENCTSANGRQISSLPGGWQIANISQTSAASYCTTIGAHLITNNEWQTIAWNEENQAANWSGGTVGSGNMGRGNSDNSVAEPASPSDGATDYLTGYADFTHRRTSTLSNGSVVWDMGGNVWQWTNDTIIGTNEPYASAGGFISNEFTAITHWGTMAQQTFGPANSAWNTTQAIGQIYSEGQVDATAYGFLRGGSWAAGSQGGVENLDIDSIPGFFIFRVGFRCAR